MLSHPSGINEWTMPTARPVFTVFTTYTGQWGVCETCLALLAVIFLLHRVVSELACAPDALQ